METIRIKRLSEDALIPVKATDGAACFDLYVPRDTPIQKGRNIISLDIAIELPHGFHADIRPRSGFSAKGFEDITGCRRDADVLLGTIDEDYRGNVGVSKEKKDTARGKSKADVLMRGKRRGIYVLSDRKVPGIFPCHRLP